jgi:hypothetical protein
VIAVAFNAVMRVAALETCIPWVLPVTCQTLAVLPTPACRKISAQFRLGFANLAVIAERCVHCRVSNRLNDFLGHGIILKDLEQRSAYLKRSRFGGLGSDDTGLVSDT